MANKKTKREFFGEIREIVKENTELVEFIDHELELLNKKTSAKSTKVNNKVVKIPQKEIDNLMKTLELTEQEAIETWLDDNDYTTF